MTPNQIAEQASTRVVVADDRPRIIEDSAPTVTSEGSPSAVRLFWVALVVVVLAVGAVAGVLAIRSHNQAPASSSSVTVGAVQGQAGTAAAPRRATGASARWWLDTPGRVALGAR